MLSSTKSENKISQERRLKRTKSKWSKSCFCKKKKKKKKRKEKKIGREI